MLRRGSGLSLFRDGKDDGIGFSSSRICQFNQVFGALVDDGVGVRDGDGLEALEEDSVGKIEGYGIAR